jgi:hypothetical protein
MTRPPGAAANARQHAMVVLADDRLTRWAQRQVAEHHYLHTPVDVRCSPLVYVICQRTQSERFRDRPMPIGCLIFGRPEATRVNGWYGSVEDVEAGRCPLTRWQVLNLARVWIDSKWQRGGPYFIGNLATYAIAQALQRVAYDYLVAHPPCFLDEPWELRDCLSYCDTAKHQGTIYRAANFAHVRTNERGLQTYRRPFRRLTTRERATIERLADQSQRSRQMRARRAVHAHQMPLVP